MSLMVLASAVFLLVGVTLDLVATASEEWTLYTLNQVDYNLGIWRTCQGSNCRTIPNEDDIDTVRAMMLCGLLLAAIALVCTVIQFGYSIFRKVYCRWITVIVAILTFVAMTFTVAGVVVYHREIRREMDKTIPVAEYGYSFWLGAASAVIYFLGFAYLILAMCFDFTSSDEDDESETEKEDTTQILKQRPRGYPAPLQLRAYDDYPASKSAVVVPHRSPRHQRRSQRYAKDNRAYAHDRGHNVGYVARPVFMSPQSLGGYNLYPALGGRSHAMDDVRLASSAYELSSRPHPPQSQVDYGPGRHGNKHWVPAHHVRESYGKPVFYWES
ncbi:uncharacterized protein LOC101855528 [Aplysia californica]|uniref:Uncharacterized protein LOC101855528 n=1 Tax=Aplysia californica TaxID=6500 RepID=A0ABM1AAY1_APLCA|nr:uncharacterized protein LOC101855528 [Aplysia californica]